MHTAAHAGATSGLVNIPRVVTKVANRLPPPRSSESFRRTLRLKSLSDPPSPISFGLRPPEGAMRSPSFPHVPVGSVETWTISRPRPRPSRGLRALGVAPRPPCVQPTAQRPISSSFPSRASIQTTTSRLRSDGRLRLFGEALTLGSRGGGRGRTRWQQAHPHSSDEIRLA